ncbi:MAG TPA: helix-turn-helix domain-containing protein [Chloroflexota bacterium]
MASAAGTEEASGFRRERADARLNRARILEAARAVFATEGLACPVDEIARHAGVGPGTIYRHFPTKHALFEAIVVDGIQWLTEEARALADAEHPAAAFFGFLDRFVELSSANKCLYESLAGAGFDVKAAKASASDELKRAMEHLLRRAQSAGGVRRDVTIGDVMALITGTCMAADRYGGDARGLSRIICDGLRG